MNGRCMRDGEAALLAARYEAGESSHVLAKAFGVDVNTVLKWIRSTGTVIRTRSQAGLVRIPSKRTYRLDESVFDTITEESAYWIGFLMADGCVQKKRHGQAVITLSLGEIDKGHIEKFAAFIGTDTPVSVRVGGVRKSGLPRFEARLEAHSNRIASALAKYGVVPRKSRTAMACGLETDRNFWRGVVDGDGHLAIYRGRVNFVLCGSEPLTRQFFEFCRAFVPDMPPQAHYWMKTHLWIVRLHAVRARRLVAALYGDCAIALDRKQAVAERIIAIDDRPLFT